MRIKTRTVASLYGAAAVCLLGLTPAIAGEMDWSGFYAGLHGGYLKSNARLKTSRGNLGGSMFTMGLHGGYNWQSDNYIFGLEADINPLYFGKTKKRRGTISESDFSPLATIRPRIGMAFDNALLYGTAGVSFGGGSVKGGGKEVSKLQTGWVIGAGSEYAFNNNWIMRAEYLFHGYGSSQKYKIKPATRSIKYKNSHEVRMGISYKF